MEFLEPFAEIAKWFISFLPTDFKFRRPRLNFIMVHYLYMIGWCIAGSIILYGASYMSYIDALFFAAGSATQSGLNPLNMNDVYLYQQVTMMLIACVANPIFINSSVVFVRLYWFEKRFQHIVKETREQRRANGPTTTRSKSQMKQDDDLSGLEKGVNGRQIRVLHETTKPNGMSGTSAATTMAQSKEFKEKMGLQTGMQSVTPSGSSGEGAAEVDEGQNEDEKRSDSADGDEITPRFHRDVTFADELSVAEGSSQNEREHGPDHNDFSKHIEFLQRQQRNAKAGTAIRIPGPRAFDRGEVPTELDHSNADDPDADRTRNSVAVATPNEPGVQIRSEEASAHLNADDHPERSGVKFDEPEHPGRRDREQSHAFDHTLTSASQATADRLHPNTHLRHRRGGSGMVSLHDARSTFGRTFSTLTAARSKERISDPAPYLSYQATIGRNSAFLALTAEQREELGGIEYRALKTLAKLLCAYYFGFHILGLIVYIPWIIYTTRWRDVVVKYGVDPAWWGIFTPASMFNDLGFTLTPNSMNGFQTSTVALLLGSYLIIIGNTGFPCMLRFTIWACSKIAPYGSRTWEELRFLLDHPRRCFTLRFPSKATWWLFWVLVLLNGIDLIFFIILDLNDKTVTHLPPKYRVLDGWFQAASTRTAGFSCVDLYYLHPAIQVSYLVMMYISVFPIAISVRRTNVYEEKSLGIWGGEEDTDEGGASYVGQHLRRQLSFDLWYIFLGFFIICIVEGGRLQNTNLYAFTTFSVLFEVVSAYGTVGLSLGYPGTDTSFSAQFHVISKLVIIAMMIRGRHRGLPYALDRAILLPSENLEKKEAEDNERRYARRGSLFAEANKDELNPIGSWEDADLDDNGLPRQNPVRASADPAMIAALGGELGPTNAQRLQRRVSGVSTMSAKRKHERSRSLSRVIAGGLSAGPTFSKHD